MVGIACQDEVEMALDYLSKLGVNKEKIFAVLLNEDGCENTSVNLEKVLEVLRI